MESKGRKHGFLLLIFVGALLFSLFSNTVMRISVVEAVERKLNKQSLILEVRQQESLKISGNPDVKWSSENKKIAKVDANGKVTALSKGKTQIYAMIEDEKYTCNVEVFKQLPTKITMKSSSTQISSGKKAILAVSVTPKNASLKKAEFSSNNPKIATVNQKGIVTGVSAGKATIKVRTVNGKIAKITIKVVPGPSVMIKGRTATLGETEKSLVKKFGKPTRRGKSNYGEKTLVYVDDIDNLMFFYMSKGKLVALYTNASTFNFNGITPASSGKKYKYNEYTKNKGSFIYKLEIDKIENNKVCGLFLRNPSISINAYTKTVLRNMEKEVFDLTNSYRKKDHLALLYKWSAAAARSARKHSKDMARKNYFSHTSLSGTEPSDRMRAEKIKFKYGGENIIGGYFTSFDQAHGWYQSFGHRGSMLGFPYQNLGVGIIYDKNSHYKIYGTQNFQGNSLIIGWE